MLEVAKLFNPLAMKITVAVAGISLAAGAGFGWWSHSVLTEAKSASDLKSKVQQLQEANATILQQASHMSLLRDQAALATIDHQIKVEVVTRRIPVEVIRYVQDNSSCDLTVGAVGLLNDARVLSRVEVREAPSLSDEEKHAASTLTQRAEVEAHADAAAQYATLAKQLDELVDFVDNQLSIINARK